MKLNILKHAALKAKSYTKSRSSLLVFTTDNSFKGFKNNKSNFLSITSSLLKLNLQLCIYKTIATFLSKTINLFFLTIPVTPYFIKTSLSSPGFIGLILNKNFYNSFQLNNLENLDYQFCSLSFINTLKKSLIKFKALKSK